MASNATFRSPSTITYSLAFLSILRHSAIYKIQRNLRKLLFRENLWNFKRHSQSQKSSINTKKDLPQPKHSTSESNKPLYYKRLHETTKKELYVSHENETIAKKYRPSWDSTQSPLGCNAAVLTTTPPNSLLSEELISRNNSNNPTISIKQQCISAFINSVNTIPYLTHEQLLHSLSANSLRINKSPGDGHCLIHSIKYSINNDTGLCTYNNTDLLAAMQEEVYNNLQEYSAYLPTQNIVNQMNRYLNEKFYNSDFVDILPLIFANCLKTNIIILNIVNHIIQTISIQSTRYIDATRNRIILLRKEDHYDSVNHASPNHKIRKHTIPIKERNINPPKLLKPKAASVPSYLLTNIRSLKNKFEEASTTIQLHQCDINIITETWLFSGIEDQSVNIPGFTHIRKDRKSTGGGVMIYLKDNISYEQYTQTNYEKSENIIIYVPTYNLLLIALYHPFWNNSKEHNNIMEFIITVIDSYSNKFCNITIAGDFNGLSQNFSDISNAYRLKNIVEFNTRFDSSIDCIFTNSKLPFNCTKCAPIGTSDHATIIAKPKAKAPPKIERTKIPDFSPANRELFRQLMHITDFSVNQSDPLDYNCELFLSKIDSLLQHCFPLKSIKIYKNENCPWINNSIRMLIRKRDIAYRRNQKTIFKHYRSKVKKAIHRAKNASTENIKRLQSRKEWNSIKELSNLRNNKANDNAVFDAEKINEYFMSVFNNEQNDIEIDINSAPINPLKVEDSEIQKYIETCKKGGGTPYIPSWVLRNFSNILTKPISDLCNQSFKEQRVPQILKQNTITPIPKTKNPKAVEEYRPITSVSPLLKIMEKCVLKHWLSPTIQKNPSHFDDQFAFIPIKGRGCPAAVTLAYGKILEKTEEKQLVSTTLVDFSKAFDKASVSTIINSLGNMKAPSECICWCYNYLVNRLQRTRFGSELSEFKPIASGTPQGGIISPVLFSLILADLKPISNNATYIKYADDLTIICWGKDKAEVEQITQSELNNVASWCNIKGMVINTKKTQVMFINKQNNPPLNLKINGCPIETTSNAKLLGIWLQDDLKWGKHFKYAVNKASRKLFNLILLKRAGCPPNVCETFYQYLIRSHLVYCCPVFCNATKHQKGLLQKFERRCYRIFNTKVQNSVLNHCDKICKKLANNVIREVSHPLRQLLIQNSGRQTRSHRNVTVRSGTSARYSNSFLKYFLNTLPIQF